MVEPLSHVESTLAKINRVRVESIQKSESNTTLKEYKHSANIRLTG